MYLNEVVTAFEQMVDMQDTVEIMGQIFTASEILESNELRWDAAFEAWLDDNYDVEWSATVEEHLYSPK